MVHTDSTCHGRRIGPKTLVMLPTGNENFVVRTLQAAPLAVLMILRLLYLANSGVTSGVTWEIAIANQRQARYQAALRPT